MRITENGNVGIGTTNPKAELDVNTGAALTGTVSINGTTAVVGTGTNFTSALSIGDYIVIARKTRKVVAIADDTNLTVDIAFTITLSGIEIAKVGMIIQGNVGIGTTAPLRTLHVNNTSGQVGLQVDGNDSSWSSIYINAVTAGAWPNFGYQQEGVTKATHYVDSSGNWNIDVNFVPRITVTTDGNVGIGTTNPQAKLHVEGPGFPEAFLYLNSTGGNNDSGMRFLRDGGTKWHIFNSSTTDSFSIRDSAFSAVLVAEGGQRRHRDDEL